MPEPTFTKPFVELMQALDTLGIKRPISIQLANKEEALRIVSEIGPPYASAVMHRAESGEMQGFLLFGIEFWWRPSIVAVKLPQDLKEAA